MTPEQKTIAIVHYNTPELTQALVRSLRMHGGEAWQVVILDNSNERKWTKQMEGVTVIDNTQGQLIDFDAQLAQWPKRNFRQGDWAGCGFGSVKHMLSVDWLIWNLDGPFVLADSDILLKQDINEIWDTQYTAVGEPEKAWGNPGALTRLLPFLCFINAPECRRLGLHYHDPARSFALGVDKDWYDTGASFYEDLTQTPEATIKRMRIDTMIEHYGSGSWRKGGVKMQAVWLKQHEWLWVEGAEKNEYYSIINEREPQKVLIMVHIKATTQDGRQFRLVAEEGYVLRSKTTGKTYHQIDTTDLKRWEAVEEGKPATDGDGKPKTQKRGVRKGK